MFLPCVFPSFYLKRKYFLESLCLSKLPFIVLAEVTWGWIPRLGRSPGEGKGYALQYSGLENSMDCVSPWVCKESN